MRGQAHTLEAVVAGLLMLSSVIFALQMTAVTPLSASTSSQHIENQQEATAQGVLAAAASQNALKPAILYWNNSSERFHETENEQFYTTNRPTNTTFGTMLQQSFDDRGIAYNVYLGFQGFSGALNRQEYIYSGVPSDNAVAATHTVTLFDDDHLYEEDGTVDESITVENSTHYVDDSDGELFNTVRIEVVVWRI